MLAGLTMTQPVWAEEEDAERLGRANARAIGAYRRAEVREARSTLSRAARAAKRAGMRGAPLARTYANLAVVLAEGAHNHERAVRAFRRALAEDPAVAPDAALRTPAVMEAFADAGGAALARVEADNDNDVDEVEPQEVEPPPRARVPTPSEVAELQWRDAEQGLRTEEAVPEDADARVVEEEPVALHASKHQHPRWFVEMGVGIGFSALRQGHAPDRLPESEVLTDLVEDTHATAKERTDHGEHSVDDEVAEHVERELREEGWDCDAVQGEQEVRAENCRVASGGGVSVMEPIFDMAAGYHVLPRFALSLTALVQRNHGAGPMAGVLVGVRSETMLTAPADRGFQLGAITGIGVGSLQARSRRLASHAPHATNGGPGGIGASIALGAKAAYRTNRNLAFSVMPLFNIGLPYVLYDMGLTGGVEVAF